MAEDTKNTVITMRQSEALAAQRQGNTVDAAQKAVDSATAALEEAKSNLVAAKANAKNLPPAQPPLETGDGSGGGDNSGQPAFDGTQDPGKYTVIQIGDWARATSDVKAIKAVQKAEGEGKGRAGVDTALAARLEAIKAGQ